MALTEPQVAAIGRYTGSHYIEINGDLRGDSASDPQVFTDIALLDQALENSVIPERTVVYRGIDEARARALAEQGLTVGTIIEDAGFLSTTRDKMRAQPFRRGGGLLLEIVLPAGCHALDIAPFSCVPSEQEILLPRNAHLRVVGYDESEDMLRLEVEVHG